jgi:hypothetical protein
MPRKESPRQRYSLATHGQPQVILPNVHRSSGRRCPPPFPASSVFESHVDGSCGGFIVYLSHLQGVYSGIFYASCTVEDAPICLGRAFHWIPVRKT